MQNSQDFQFKIPKIFNFYRERHKQLSVVSCELKVFKSIGAQLRIMNYTLTKGVAPLQSWRDCKWLTADLQLQRSVSVDNGGTRRFRFPIMHYEL